MRTAGPEYSVFPRHSGRIIWPMIAFLAGFAALLVMVCYGYLFPAMRAFHDAPPQQKQQLAATGRLMLAVVLFILIAGLVLAFRLGRFFLPRHRRSASPTQYTDAWAEAGRRVKLPPD